VRYEQTRQIPLAPRLHLYVFCDVNTYAYVIIATKQISIVIDIDYPVLNEIRSTCAVDRVLP